MQELIDYTQDLLGHMGVSGSSVRLEESEDTYQITIDVSEQESGMLIGHHGETISAFQRLLNVSFRDKLNDKRVLLNINDYKQQREEVLKNMAERYAQRAIESGRPQVLPYLSASERLVIHVALKDHDQVATESEGEGAERRLVVSLKN